MFPDLARDDVFRLETPRLWLRWPRICDAAAIHRFCSRWEVARYTARIPHPYPPGSAERFIYAAREANAVRTRFDPGHDADQGQARRHRLDQPRIARHGPPGARLCAGAGGLGQGSRDRGGGSDDRRSLHADPDGRDPGQRQGRERGLAAVLGKCGFAPHRHRPARRAGARRAWSNATSFRLARADWTGRAPRSAQPARSNWRARRDRLRR